MSADEVATEVLKKTSGRTEASDGGTSISSPLEALERDEILRTRKFAVLIGVIALVGVATCFAMPGANPVARAILVVAVALGFASMVLLLLRTRDPAQFRRPSTPLVWFAPAVAVNAAVIFFGPFSPAPMVVVLGLYFLGLGKSSGMPIAAYVLSAVCHGTTSAFVIAGVGDLGIVNPPLDNAQRIIIAVLVQIIMAITTITARLSRQTALLAVGELEQAVRLAAHRQALLLEAREELERALRPKRGRFSDQTIGPYQLGDVLGRGAMGEVYAAIDTRSSAPVAIKLLSQASLGNPQYVLRFLRELRTAAAITSPHVVRVIEVGDQPVPFLVMEKLDGHTLAEILRDRRTLTPAEVVALVDQVGIGITAAAAAGVVHRDLKPQNVFRHQGTWKVLDFGVARAIDHGDTLTGGHIVGTPGYMAPEQARGEPVDHLTDLYALAAIAYRALTGHAPFGGRDLADTIYRVVHTRPARPTLVAPELPADLDLVLAIGLAQRPGQRFTTAAELSAAIRDALTGRLSSAVRARGEAVIRQAAWGERIRA